MSGPHPDPLDPAQALEPPALSRALSDDWWQLSRADVIALSTALSAKRQADALETIAASLGRMTPTDGFGLLDVLSENHLWNLGRAFGNGQRT